VARNTKKIGQACIRWFHYTVLMLVESNQCWYSYRKIPNRPDSILSRGQTSAKNGLTITILLLPL